MSARPHDKYRGQVHYQHHYRHHYRHCSVYKQIQLGKVIVGMVKSVLFIFLSVKGSDYQNSSQSLVHYKVQLIDLFLHNLELWKCNDKHKCHKNYYRAKGYADGPCKRHTGSQCFDYCAYTHYRRKHAKPQGHYRSHLYLLYVIGGSCNKRGCGEVLHFLICKVHYLSEHSLSDISCRSCRRL